MNTFSVKNFERFQHYKDRAPPWIKLYNEILDDYEFGQLPDASKLHLIAIWLLASRSENKIPYDPVWVARRINANEHVDLDALARSGFIIVNQSLHTSEQHASNLQAKCLSRDREETETETETERTSSSLAKLPTAREAAEAARSDARRGYEELEKKLREAAGWQNEPAPNLCIVGPIQAVMDAGADLELDVLPTVRAIAGKARNRTSWNFFVGAIKDAQAARVSAGKPNAAQDQATAERERKRREAERFLAEHNARTAANG